MIQALEEKQESLLQSMKKFAASALEKSVKSVKSVIAWKGQEDDNDKHLGVSKIGPIRFIQVGR